jgi:hypothetical protein
MNKIREAQEILRALGLPPAQQNEISALTLLALCGVGPRASWRSSARNSLTISKGIMAFVEDRFGRKYAPNTRETFRRQVLHQFVQAGIALYNPDAPSLPTNSPRAHYAISDEALSVVRAWGTPSWQPACRAFLKGRGGLLDLYEMKRPIPTVPVRLPDGRTLRLSPGLHNKVQVAVVRDFAPRFAPGARLLYLGDTAKKTLLLEADAFERLGVAVTEHGKLPDVVLHHQQRNWLILVEAVTSHGPISPKRVVELKRMFSQCSQKILFVTAFPDFATFRRHIRNIAWETEVWIADAPDHLIHYNGDKFLGPR